MIPTLKAFRFTPSAKDTEQNQSVFMVGLLHFFIIYFSGLEKVTLDTF